MDTPLDVLAAVLAAVLDEYETCGRTLGQVQIAVGNAVVDDCCTGSLLVVPERIYRTTFPFPTEALGDEVCGDTPIAVSVLVRVDRCTPGPDDRGNPPSKADVDAANAVLLTDAAIVWRVLGGRAILGSDYAGDPLWERAGLSQTFPPSEGECIAVETRVTFGVDQGSWCLACPPDPPT